MFSEPSMPPRKTSIARLLSAIVAISLTALTILISCYLFFRLDAVFNASQQENTEREIAGIVQGFNLFTNLITQDIKEHAKFPIMTQAVMQPELHQGAVQDFMSDFTVLNHRFQQTLVNFECQAISKILSQPVFEYAAESWCLTLMDQEPIEYVNISHHPQLNEYYFRIAIPIYYNNHAEGVLVTEVPLHAVDEFFDLSQRLRGLYLEFIHQGKVVKTFGIKNSASVIDKALSIPHTLLRFRQDLSAIHQARFGLLTEMLLMLLLLTTLMVMATIKFCRRVFVQPLTKLQTVATELAEGISIAPILTQHQRIQEFTILGLAFNRMVERVQERERQLRASSETLEKTNKELQASQTQLVQSEKMASLGTLAAGVAHEINNPVGFIKSNLNTLRDYSGSLYKIIEAYEGIETPLEQQDLVAAIEHLRGILALKASEDLDYLRTDTPQLLDESLDGIERVQDIVQNLRDFARLDQSEHQDANINDCIESTLKIVANELKYKCEVHKELGDIPNIPCFPGKLNQVLTNLFINAVQAIKGQGHITVKSRAEGQNIYVSVSDTGEGIVEEHLSQLFNPFFTTKPVGFGTGLGLAISHSIIEEHLGRMEVESELGKGTTFTIILPIPEEV